MGRGSCSRVILYENLGINDLKDESANGTLDRMWNVIDRLLSLPNVKIVVNLLLPCNNRPHLLRKINSFNDKLDSLIRILRSESDIVSKRLYVILNNNFWDHNGDPLSDKLLSDDLHVNDVGLVKLCYNLKMGLMKCFDLVRQRSTRGFISHYASQY